MTSFEQVLAELRVVAKHVQDPDPTAGSISAPELAEMLNLSTSSVCQALRRLHSNSRITPVPGFWPRRWWYGNPLELVERSVLQYVVHVGLTSASAIPAGIGLALESGRVAEALEILHRSNRIYRTIVDGCELWAPLTPEGQPS